MIQTILLIQNDAKAAHVARDALRHDTDSQFKIQWVKSCGAGIKCLAAARRQRSGQSSPIAAILVDIVLRDAVGLETIDRLVAAALGIPIIALCTLANERVAKEAIQRGAQDYLVKEHLSSYTLLKMLAAVIERASFVDALFDEKERAQITLNSIGDAVICSDVRGCVSYMNVVAEKLTGWKTAEALGRPVEDVVKIIDAVTREPIPNPLFRAAAQNATVGLPPTCTLIQRDGVEAPIEDSCAPIHDRHGSIKGAVMVFRDVTAARAMTEKFAYMAQHDTLTDLPNRALLMDRIKRAIALARRHHTTLSLLYIDLDRFKRINDSLGHSVGDLLLQSVAARMETCVRTTDTVSRLGGDEFVILLGEVAHERHAAICAEKIIQTLRMPYMLGGHEVHIGASIGIAAYPGDGTTVETLMHNADCAMYEAKKHGCDNYQFYRSDLNSRAGERQTLEIALRHALQQQQFQLRYQPVVDLNSGAVAGVEALIRWQHPTRGLVLPDQFVPIAEESGLIVPMGQWALREACHQAEIWLQTGLPPMRMAVNISAVELRSKDFVSGVEAVLAETRFDPRSLELELTETFLMQDPDFTASVLNDIKGLGVQLALDDFGTGYSSLSYMRRFPIDSLKVDQSFVRDLGMDASDASVVSAIINLGKSLNMRVVAEGVEAMEQVTFLKQIGCSEAQGHYFSEAILPDDCATWMRKSASDRLSG